MQDFVYLGDSKYARTRIRPRSMGGAYQVGPNGEKMTIFLIEPSQKIRVEGKESVSQALLEIERACDED